MVPLGLTFAKKVLHAGDAGFSLLLTALGTGVALGVLGLSFVQKRVPRERLFPLAVLGAGAALLVGASMSSLALASVFVHRRRPWPLVTVSTVLRTTLTGTGS